MSRVCYAMMHEGGGGEMTDGRPHGAQRAARPRSATGPASSATRSSSWRSSATRSCTTSCSASTRSRSARRRSRWRPTAPSDAARASSDLGAHPGARVYVLPCIAGHVGADTAGVILAEAPHEAEAIELVVDVGTNAEIVLGNRDRLLAASSPTGPAFEGAQICAGQRAAPGAIERVRIDRDDARAAVPGHRRRAWSDEPGFAEAPTAGTGVTGICGSGIVEVIAELFLAGRHHRRRHHRRRARRAHAADRRRTAGRSPTSSTTAGRRRPADRHHPERRPGDPAREGRALRRRPAADGPRRDRDGRRDPARRRVRQPDRPVPRDGPRADPRLRPRPRQGRRQRRRDRRADRAAAAAPRGARSRASSAGSRRSRPRSSRASRSTSSTRWRSRTGPRRSRTSARS